MKEDDPDAFKLLVQWMFTSTIDKPKLMNPKRNYEGWGIREDDSEGSMAFDIGDNDTEEVGAEGIEMWEIDVERIFMERVNTEGVDAEGIHGTEQAITATSASNEAKSPLMGIWAYVKLHVLADKLCMRQLKNYTIDLIRDGTVPYLLPVIIAWIYGNTAPSTPLRKFAANSAVSTLLLKTVVYDRHHRVLEVCPEFATDLVEAMRYQAKEVIFSNEPFYNLCCGLHEHRIEDVCEPGMTPTPAMAQWNYLY